MYAVDKNVESTRVVLVALIINAKKKRVVINYVLFLLPCADQFTGEYLNKLSGICQ